MSARLAWLVLAACGAPAAPPPANAGGSAPSPPDVDVLRAVLPHVAFGSDTRGCVSHEGVDAYAANLVAAGRKGFGRAGDRHTLTGGCGDFPAGLLPIDPPRDDAYWFCVVDARVVDPAGDSPWHYALHIRMRKADGVIDVATAACPGQ